MKKISWGIIGCGDVTELKSGPAFNKVNNSELVAVMRRDGVKAKDYALRHNVPKWYTDANELINDPAINAVYIATPPSSHEEYTMAVLAAGKPVYVEKPMTMNAASAGRMMNAVAKTNGKLAIAHYRRAQPLFKKVKQLVADKAIGNARFARISLYKKSYTQDDLNFEKTAWRVDPALAGGGLFHDLSPHQLDLMYYFLGEPAKANGIANNQAGLYPADDMVTGNILFKSGVQFNGVWCFNVAASDEEDSCEIVGDKGKIIFSFFEHRPVKLIIDGKTESISFDPLQHVQQPMIQEVVNYFLDDGPNPCSAEDGLKVMTLIDKFTGK
ncbi:MAG: Gfo/Idh/MocA family oxidoreductase [Chitinophagaceae bacterium]